MLRGGQTPPPCEFDVDVDVEPESGAPDPEQESDFDDSLLVVGEGLDVEPESPFLEEDADDTEPEPLDFEDELESGLLEEEVFEEEDPEPELFEGEEDEDDDIIDAEPESELDEEPDESPPFS